MSNRKIIAVLYFKKEDVFNLFNKHIVCCSSDINLLISMIEPNMNAINKLRNCLQNNSKDYFNKGFSDVERLQSKIVWKLCFFMRLTRCFKDKIMTNFEERLNDILREKNVKSASFSFGRGV